MATNHVHAVVILARGCPLGHRTDSDLLNVASKRRRALAGTCASVDPVMVKPSHPLQKAVELMERGEHKPPGCRRPGVQPPDRHPVDPRRRPRRGLGPWLAAPRPRLARRDVPRPSDASSAGWTEAAAPIARRSGDCPLRGQAARWCSCACARRPAPAPPRQATITTERADHAHLKEAVEAAREERRRRPRRRSSRATIPAGCCSGGRPLGPPGGRRPRRLPGGRSRASGV